MPQNLLKKILKPIFWFFYELFSKIANRLPLDFDNSLNWGDKLTPYLVSRISGRKCYIPRVLWCSRFFVIGSILSRVDSNSLVWGAGFISAKSFPKFKPRKIFAVRGPLTRNIFIEHGIDCPQVFGDPAILVSSFFPVSSPKKYRYGIIPHYADKSSSWVDAQLELYGQAVVLIDIFADIEVFTAKVAACEFIFSSSLHGLICADSYGIQNAHIVLGSKVIGGNFKFDDYRLGVEFTPHVHINPIDNHMNLVDLEKFSDVADVSSTSENLLRVCPFK